MRYDTGIPLGRGAAGEVLEVWDPALERRVALKILRRDDPEAAARMLREARSQARIDHPNVCRVFDTGETADGRPYIAMQLVDGVPLDVAARGRTREAKVRLMRTVAEAVQAAHQAGLVHRDLKPGNILVEEASDGEPVPYVLDFGIAREHEVAGFTMTGQVVGTPGYMSPEQARGETRSLDRRSDVFALGVLLYELLAEQHPFAAESPVAALVKILQEEPPPLRTAAPSVPADLAAVVERCLEKDPDRRYGSARELADELGRWLAGEPVHARISGPLGRLARRARKHPRTLAAAVTAGVALLLAAGIVVRTRWVAAEQTRHAEEFGRRIERLDTAMRLAHLSPLHDLTADRSAVLREMVEIERIVAGGGAAVGPGLHALGRGALHLGRLDDARRYLESAWERGYRTDAVALSLGRVYGALFVEAVAEADRLLARESQRIARDEARRRFGVPARRFLGRAAEARDRLPAHERDYLMALLALAEEDHALAARKAREAAAPGWFFEADLLVGDVALREAEAALAATDLEEASDRVAAAASAFSSATAKAPSSPRAHLGRCRSALQAMELASARGEAPDSDYERAREACATALQADPGLAAAWTLLAQAGTRVGVARARRGEDPTAALAEAFAAAERAIAVDSASPAPRAVLAQIHFARAERLGDIGADPANELAAGIRQIEDALGRAPGDRRLLLELADGLVAQGRQESWFGRDPVPTWTRAIETYGLGAGGPPTLGAPFLGGRCRARTELGYFLFLRGDPPGALFEEALADCRRALEGAPRNLAILNDLGMAWWSRAEYEAAVGLDPELSFREGAATFEQALERDPDRSSVHVNLSHLLEEHAAWRLAHGAEPLPWLARAERHAARYESIYPADFTLIQGKIELVRARWLASRGLDARQAWEAATGLARRLGELQPDRPVDVAFLAEVLRHRTRDGLARETLARAELLVLVDEGLAAAARALALDAEDPEIHAHRARLEAVRAEIVEEPEARRAHLESARDAAETAVALRADLRPELEDLLDATR